MTQIISRGDPLLWFSRRLLVALDRPADPLRMSSLQAVDAVLERATQLQDIRRQYQRASQRGWTLSARRLADRLPPLAAYLRDVAMLSVSELAAKPTRLRPTVTDLHQELAALESEFDDLHLNRKQQVIGVTTERIRLEGIDLGPFRIELHLQRLGDDRNPAGAFVCVATDPNPPTCSQSTTHPHVRDDQPCLGEASAAVAGALREGRLLDAFLAVASVLRTYNPGSPYVALADWDGESCSDCGQTTSEDDLYHCESCDARCCEGCSSSCDVCHGSFCIGCLERDEEDQNLCAGCRGRCEDCNTITEQSVLEQHGGRCRGCAEHEGDAAETEDPEAAQVAGSDADAAVLTAAVLELRPPSETEPAPPPIPASADASSIPTDPPNHPNLEQEYE